MLQDLKDRIDRPLVAILTLNTVANTVGAAGVGAQVLKLYTERYGAAGHAGQAVAVASGTLTFLILVFSEIIPKTLGAVYWKQLAPAAGYMTKGLIIIIYPLVVMFEALSKLISRKRYQLKVSREEMAAVAEIGKAEGTLLTQETRVIQNLLRLNKIRAKDVLTPRSVLLTFQKDKTVQEVVNKHSPIRFSRIPVYGKDLRWRAYWTSCSADRNRYFWSWMSMAAPPGLSPSKIPSKPSWVWRSLMSSIPSKICEN